MPLPLENPPKPISARAGIPLSLFALMLLALGDTLFSTSSTKVLSSSGTDTATEFVYWRQFGFDQLKHGHLAFWDPHVFSGVPFFGGWQSAILYPPNWIYLFLPLSRAINWEMAISTFLVGWFTALWARKHDFSAIACVFAGAMVMLGGAFFWHIFAGHLCTLDALAWTPLILLAIDEMCDNPGIKPLLMGSGAIGMQILAGHPQTVFNTAITSVLFGLVRVVQTKQKLRAVLGSAFIAGLGFGLCAIQAIPGFTTSAEGVRQGAMDYDFASSLSFPPENFLTLITPNIFGDTMGVQYWGRWYIWELCAFASISGLALAIYGSCAGIKRKSPSAILWLCMTVALYLIALGGYTPLFHVLYSSVPGFNKFRSHSKFIFPAVLFTAMLAAYGLNELLTSRAASLKGLFAGLIAASIILLTGAVLLEIPSTATPIMTKIFYSMSASREHLLIPKVWYFNPRNISHATSNAAIQIGLAALTCIVLAVAVHAAKRRRGAIYAFVLVGLIELVVFARHTAKTFDLSITQIPQIVSFLAQDRGDYRILQLVEDDPNAAISNGSNDIWGYDPTVLKRYAEFLTYSQGFDPHQAGEYLNISRYHPLMALLRLKYIIYVKNGYLTFAHMPPHAHHVQLYGADIIEPGRNAIFRDIGNPSFDLQHVLVLESAPNPAPVQSKEPAGTVRIIDSTVNSLTIEADMTRPQLIFITDNYSKGWSATALPGSSQQSYTVMPADYTLMAIPLSAGHHLLKLEYVPVGFRTGEMITIISLTIYGMLFIIWIANNHPNTRSKSK